VTNDDYAEGGWVGPLCDLSVDGIPVMMSEGEAYFFLPDPDAKSGPGSWEGWTELGWTTDE
jgi:hypothetical protein